MAKCGICGKGSFRCRCHERPATKEKIKAKTTDQNGRTRTVTRATGNTISNGNTWCGTCSCRMMNGKCTNYTCSTNK